MRRLLATVIFFLAASIATASESLQMGVSVDVVPVGSDFDGTDIVIFGSIEGAEQAALYRGEYDVVVRVTGEQEDVVIRHKERVAGIWVNTNSKVFVDVPSFYSTLSRNPLNDIADRPTLRSLGLGIQNLMTRPESQGDLAFVLKAGQFSDALQRIRLDQGLFTENPENLKQLSPSLFRARLYLPPNVPIGSHTVTAYLFRNGEKLADIQSGFRIQKVGFERWIYDLAHNYSLLYGFAAVLIAIATGWLANVLFRKN